ncbi:hypothetical protein CBR_g41618 [Chara braunii]|uniref:Endoglucanase n=1 Tax=Chara braunii TaxID=69332 RepID=A0A388LWB5_CHABU|nr:hypothetical protein CBR_g41618 [Chara braunii]|eukprot:GBG86555.1 hypothetical protein CBR_g41618 [Chara braunii]
MGWQLSSSLAAAGDPPPPRRHVSASPRPSFASSSLPVVRCWMVGYPTTAMIALFILLSLSNGLTMTMTAEAQSIASPIPAVSAALPTAVPGSPSLPTAGVAAFNFTLALQLSTLFLDAQRSGVIPDDRVPWRGNSTLKDGADVGEDLTGGFFDSGDTTKTTFPMAFGITMLSWGVIEYRNYFAQAGELQNALRSIRWGTDYLLKVWKPGTSQLYVIVGDKFNDDKCWMRPENIQTTRLSYQVNATAPGTDVAGEVAAAFAAAALAWNIHDSDYASQLLNASVNLFVFANNQDPKGMYSDSVIVPNSYRSVSNYGDELLWGAAWLYRATNNAMFKNYTLQYAQFLGGYTDRGEFSWDDKYAAVQVLMGRDFMLKPAIDSEGLMLSKYKQLADNFMCLYLDRTQPFTPGGLLYLREQGPIQYSISSAFLAVVYADYMLQTNQQGITCAASGNSYAPAHLVNYAYSQAQYILGANPLGLSYMVGFGSNFPRRVHHRGASFPDYRTDPTVYICNLTSAVLTLPNPNPINVTGAVVGGPSPLDTYNDSRTYVNQSQVQFSTGALWTSLLVRLTAPPPSATPPPVVVSTPPPTTVSPSASGPGPTTPDGENPNCPDPAANGYPGVNYTIETVFQYTKYGESVAQYRCIIWNNNLCAIRDLTINCEKFIATEYWQVRVISKNVCMLKEDKPVLAIMERYEFGYVQTTALKPVFSTKSYTVEPA